MCVRSLTGNDQNIFSETYIIPVCVTWIIFQKYGTCILYANCLLFCIEIQILYSITRLMVHLLYYPLTIWINEYIYDFLYGDLISSLFLSFFLHILSNNFLCLIIWGLFVTMTKSQCWTTSSANVFLRINSFYIYIYI